MANVLLKEGSTGKEVEFLQTWLNVLVEPSPQLGVSGTFDRDTHTAAAAYQASKGLSADGVVGAFTWWEVMNDIRWRPWAGVADPPDTPFWLENFWIAPTNRVVTVVQAHFDEVYQALFKTVTPTGLQTLLGYLQGDAAVDDIRWAAYMLATVKHECAGTWRPIEEYGKGAGHAYGNPVVGPDGNAHTYYGRGYVQLTWQGNYQTMSTALGLSGADDLVTHPERALDPDIAYRIMSHGIAGYAKQLELCLVAGL
jgi:hypothetical protein